MVWPTLGSRTAKEQELLRKGKKTRGEGERGKEEEEREGRERANQQIFFA